MSSVALHHVIDGPTDAPVVMLSPSLGATLAMWEPQVGALAERFRVVRHDQRGHGGSPVPPGPYGIEDLGGDLLALLDAVGVDHAHLCGLSLGGMAALWAGVHAPERVASLSLLCTSARLGAPSSWTERAATVRAHGTAAVADTVVKRWLTADFRAAHPERTATLRAMIAATPPEGYAGCCEVVERMDLERQLGAVRAPTLVIAGAQDEATPPVHAERLAAGIPAAHLEVLSPAAHLANVEQADAVTRLLLAHLMEER